MKKVILMLSSLALLMFPAKAETFETAAKAVANIGVGWNLGNTLDSHDGENGKAQGLESETYWGQPKASAGVMTLMKEAGFGAIRVPVTWYNHMDASGKVDPAWMARVKEVVDYVMDAGLYCILNVHHDTGADGKNHKTWLKADETYYTNNKAKYEYLWQQIATEFKDYGPRLLFESYNEMLDPKNSWCFASFAAPGQYNATIANSAYSAINKYAQSFVNVVRKSGGNNAQRNLIINTYGACSGAGTWNTHLQDPLKNLNKPTGETDHIIFQIHSYPSIVKTDNNGNVTGERTITEINKEIDQMLTDINTYLCAKAPVIFGEWGTSNVDKGTDYVNHRPLMMQFVESFVKKTKEYKMATFYWMGLSEGSARALEVFNQADLAETIVKAYRGTNFPGKYPSINDIDLHYQVDYTQQYAECNVFQGAASLSTYSGVRVELDKSYSSSDLQLKAYDSSGKEQYNGQTGAIRTLNFTKSTLTSGTVTRVTLQAFKAPYTATIKKAYLVKKDGTLVEQTPSSFWGCSITAINAASGIETIVSGDKLKIQPTYNLQGQRVETGYKGLVVRDGKIILQR